MMRVVVGVIGLLSLPVHAAPYVFGTVGTSRLDASSASVQIDSITENTVRFSQSHNHRQFGFGFGKQFHINSDWLDSFSLGLGYYHFRDNKLHGEVLEYGESSAANYTAEVDVKAQALFLEGRMTAAPTWQTKPYLSLGLGVSKNSTGSYFDRPHEGMQDGTGITLQGESHYDFAKKLTLGVSHQISDHFYTDLSVSLSDLGEGRVSNQYRNAVGNVNAGPDINLIYRTFALSITYFI